MSIISKPNQDIVFREQSGVTESRRARLLGHRVLTAWLTGLSGSGKSTIAKLLELKLIERGINAYTLDGDNLRLGLTKGLGFTVEGRNENIRRAAEVCKLMNQAGVVVIAAFISPFAENRRAARCIVGEPFREVHIDADIEVCRRRDTKGLYAKADRGEIPDFTGVSSPYERPENPDVYINTDAETPETSSNKMLEYILGQIGLDHGKKA